MRDKGMEIVRCSGYPGRKSRSYESTDVADVFQESVPASRCKSGKGDEIFFFAITTNVMHLDVTFID